MPRFYGQKNFNSLSDRIESPNLNDQFVRQVWLIQTHHIHDSVLIYRFIYYSMIIRHSFLNSGISAQNGTL